ncbi:sodium:solute symporter family protein [candidate division WOR-3 bacterium]|nr:sodium:solute symporter family protein [candidate division WOR-3 bacterium]
MNNTVVFWIAAMVYAGICIVMGFISWGARRHASPGRRIADFWIAGRELPGWVLGVSLATGWLMLGWLGYGMSMVYQMGLSGTWMLFLPWFILMFIIIWMVPFVRRLPAISLPEALSKRFGPSVRTLTALCSIFVFTSWTGAETYMLGQLGAPFLKISPVATMVVLTIPVMIYIGMGGFRADALTDVLQFVVNALFVVVLAVVGFVAARSLANGDYLGALARTATPNYGPGSMFRLFACGIAMPIILLIAYMPGWMIEQDLLLRIQGAKSLKEGFRMAYWSLALVIIFVVIFPLWTAFNAIILFPPGAEGSAAAIGSDATGIISAIILNHFPAWAQVLMLIGILASQMSTIDTFSNVTAMPLMYDFIQPRFMKKTDKRVVMNWTRAMAVVAIVLGLVYAINSTSLMDVYVLSSGVLTASIAVPAFAVFWKKANRLGVVLSVVLGFLGNVVFYILEYRVWKHVYQPAWLANTYLGYIIVGILASVVGLLLGSLLGKRSSPEELAAVAPKPLEGVEVFDVVGEGEGTAA